MKVGLVGVGTDRLWKNGSKPNTQLTLQFKILGTAAQHQDSEPLRVHHQSYHLNTKDVHNFSFNLIILQGNGHLEKKFHTVLEMLV